MQFYGFVLVCCAALAVANGDGDGTAGLTNKTLETKVETARVGDDDEVGTVWTPVIVGTNSTPIAEPSDSTATTTKVPASSTDHSDPTSPHSRATSVHPTTPHPTTPHPTTPHPTTPHPTTPHHSGSSALTTSNLFFLIASAAFMSSLLLR